PLGRAARDRRRTPPPDLGRERGEPAPRARARPPPRDLGAPRSRRRPRPARPPAPDRGGPPRPRGRRPRARARALGQGGALGAAAAVLPRLARPAPRPPHPRLHLRGLARH